jgi:D-xylose transport system ATP-binding protein
MQSHPIIETLNLSKEFYGTKALININLSIFTGEILAIVGENGAGKSTLVRILSGVFDNNSYTGSFSLNGITQQFKTPKDAQKAGISIIHQELLLINDLSAGENIFIGNWPKKSLQIDWKKLHDDARKVLKDLGLAIDTRSLVKDLGISQLQLIEIAKAISHESKVLILDEPTAALTEVEGERLFSLLRELKNQGVTIVYISHRLKEVLKLADRIAVLRDGNLVGVKNSSELSYQKVVSMMIGRELSSLFPRDETKKGEIKLSVKNFSVEDHLIKSKRKVNNISFNLHAGEILGISGLLGAGRTELALALFGDNRARYNGEVYLDGKKIKINSPEKAIKSGIALVTEDRKSLGIIPEFDVNKNITLATLKNISKFGIISHQKEKKVSSEYIRQLRIKVKNGSDLITSLSGGNQQKVMIARWLISNPKVLILDEPTRGIDVEAKAEIYILMQQLARQGMAILMISSDLMEVLEISDRVIVLCEGNLTGEFSHNFATEEKIMACATGTMLKEI